MKCNTFILAALLVLLCFSAPSFQRGVLRADIVFSSSEDTITFEALEVDNAQLTSTTADTLHFGSFDQLSVSSAGIQAAGSYLLAQASSSLSLQSSQSPVSFSAGQSVISNSGSGTSFLSNAGDVNIESPRGSILLEAREEIAVSASGNTLLNAESGGIFVGTEPGVISLTAGSNADFLGTGAVNFNTQEQQFFYASSLLALKSNGDDLTLSASYETSVEGSDSLTLVANNGDVDFQSSGALHIGASNDLNFSSQNGTLSLSSDTNNFNLFSLLGNTISSSQNISFTGTNQGVNFNSYGTNAGFNLNAYQGATYTATGNGANNGFGIQVGSVQSVSSNSTYTTASNIDAVATGSVIFSGQTSTNAHRFLNMQSDNIDASAQTFSTLSAPNGIYFTAEDRALGSGSYGLVEFDSAETVSISASSQFNIQAGSAILTSSGGDISFSSNFFELLANRGTGNAHAVAINAVKDITINSGSTSWTTGELIVQSNNVTVDSQGQMYFYYEIGGNYVAQFIFQGDQSNTLHSSSTGAFAAEDVIAQVALKASFSANAFQITSASSNPFSNNLQFATGGNSLVETQGTAKYVSILNSNFLFGNNLAITAQSGISLSGNQNVDFSLAQLTSNSEAVSFSSVSSLVSFSTRQASDAGETFSITGNSGFSVTATSQNILFEALGNFSVSTNGLLDLQASQNINFQSDNNNGLNIQTAALEATFSSQTTFTALSNNFASGNTTFKSATGGTLNSNNDLFGTSSTFEAKGTTLSVSSNGNLLLDAGNSFSLSTAAVTIASGNGGSIESLTGSLVYTSSSTSALNAGQNLTVSSGLQGTHLFSKATQTFQSNNYLSLYSEFGSISMDVANGATITANNLIFQGSSSTFGVASGNLVVNANSYSEFNGGNIQFNFANLTLNSQQNINFLSLDNTLGGKLLNNAYSAVSFAAQNNITFASQSLVDFYAEEYTQWNAQTSFTTQASSVTFVTQPNAFDESFAAGGNILFQSTSNTFGIEFDSANDFSVNVGGYTSIVGGSTISQSNLAGRQSFTTAGSFATFSNNTGAITYSVPGAALNPSGDLISIANTTTTVEATTGSISISSFGYDYRRTPDDSLTNPKTAGVFETIGFSIYTNAAPANIFLQSADALDFTANNDLFVDAVGIVRQSATNNFTMSSNGTMFINSADGPTIVAAENLLNIDTTNNLQAQATRYAQFIASESQFSLISQSAVDITAQHGGVAFFAEQGFVSFYATDVISWTSGNTVEVSTKQDIDTITGTGDFEGYSGVSFLANSGPVSLSAGGLNFVAGRDLDMYSGGAFSIDCATSNIALEATDKIYVSTSAGKINQVTQNVIFSSNNVKLPGNDLLIQSSGSSQTGRDHILIASSTGEINVFSATTAIDAVENINIGIATRPDVMILGGGDVFTPGINVVSSGNVLFSPVDQYFQVEATNSNIFTSTYATSFLARQDVNIVSSVQDISFFTYGTALIDAPLGKIFSFANASSYISGASTGLLSVGPLTFTTTDPTPVNSYQITTNDLYVYAQGGAYSVTTVQPGSSDIILSSTNSLIINNQAALAAQPITFVAQNGDIDLTTYSYSTINVAGDLNFEVLPFFTYTASASDLTTINTPSFITQAQTQLNVFVNGNLNINAQTSSIGADALTQTSLTNTIFSSRYGSTVTAQTTIAFDSLADIRSRSFGSINFMTPTNEFQATATNNLAFVVGNSANFTATGSTVGVTAQAITLNSNSTSTFLAGAALNVRSNLDLDFEAYQPHALIAFNAGSGGFTVNSVATSSFLAGGSDEVNSLISINAGGATSFTANSAIFATNYNVGNQNFGPVLFESSSTINSIISGPFSFQATGTDLGTGNITMVSQSAIFSATAGDIEVVAVNGSVSYYSDTSLSFKSTLDVYIQSEATESSIDSYFTSSSGPFLLAASTNMIISSDFEATFNSATDQIQLIGSNQIKVDSSGLGGSNSAGIEFDSPTLLLTSANFNFNSFNDIDIDVGSITMTNPSTYTITSGKDLDITANGAEVPISGTITGLEIQYNGGIGALSFSSADTTIGAGNSVIFNGASTLTSTTGFYVSANQDIEINSDLTINAPAVTVNAGNGIEIEMTAGTFTSTGGVTIDTGLLPSAHSFSSSVNFETTGPMILGTGKTAAGGAGGDLNQASENNFLFKVHTGALYQAPSIQIGADRNSQLYYSSSLLGTSHNQLEIISDTGGIYVFPYDAVRHRPDYVNYKARLSFFTLQTQIANAATLNQYYQTAPTPTLFAINQPTFPAATLAHLYDVTGTQMCFVSAYDIFVNGLYVNVPFPCPGIRTKIALIAQALINYGLMLSV